MAKPPPEPSGGSAGADGGGRGELSGLDEAAGALNVLLQGDLDEEKLGTMLELLKHPEPLFRKLGLRALGMVPGM